MRDETKKKISDALVLPEGGLDVRSIVQRMIWQYLFLFSAFSELRSIGGRRKEEGKKTLNAYPTGVHTSGTRLA